MPTLSDAIVAIKSGRRDEARDMLTRILLLDQRNVTALLWMTEVSQTPEDRHKYLNRILEIDPNNTHARKGLELLGKTGEQLPAQPPTSSPPIKLTEHAKNTTKESTSAISVLGEPSAVKPDTSMTKQEIVTEIGLLEAELVTDESNLRQDELLFGKWAGNQSGCIVVILGILGVLIAIVLSIVVGLVVIIVGAIVAIANGGKPDMNALNARIKELHESISTKRERVAELKARLSVAEQAPVPSLVSADERLSKLADLKTKGQIDDAEYMAKRQKILNEI